MDHDLSGIGVEDLLDGGAEVARQADRERERGQVAPRLDRVDRLARDAERLRERGLAELASGAEATDVVDAWMSS